MRKIDWESPLSEDDIIWLRASGQLGVEERIAAHQAKFDADTPEIKIPNDEVSKSALDPDAFGRGTPVGSDGAPVNVTPEPGTRQAGDALTEDEVADAQAEYQSWKAQELKDEVAARDELAASREDVSPVSVTGTGTNGAVTKADLVKALVLWDQENPGVLDAENTNTD